MINAQYMLIFRTERHLSIVFPINVFLSVPSQKLRERELVNANR